MQTAVKCFLRLRPLRANEPDANHRIHHSQIISVCPVGSNETMSKSRSRALEKTHVFEFDHIFDQEASQEYIFKYTVESLVDQWFKGVHCSLLAYGQTGSGKTWTMGSAIETASLIYNKERAGLIPRVSSRLFDLIKADSNESTFTLEASFFELYNEEFYDLLQQGNANATALYNHQSYEGTKRKSPNCFIQIREDSDGSIQITGDYTRQKILRAEDAMECLLKGIKNRTTASTMMNENSSRSHAIFTLTLRQKTANGVILTSKFNFVDLAGSERIKRTQATGERAKEGIAINTELLALGNVISALTEEKSTFVPYRDSKLTRFLQESLGGNSQTVMIACISPSMGDWNESINTMKYASRARRIKNEARVNIDMNESMVQAERINQLEAELSRLKEEKLAADIFTKALQEENAVLQEKLEKLKIKKEEKYIAKGLFNDEENEGASIWVDLLEMSERRRKEETELNCLLSKFAKLISKTSAVRDTLMVT